MAGAVIGALRVNLGIDTAAFSKGLKQSEGRLGKFGAIMRRALPFATVAAAVGGFTLAMRGAINKADQFAKSAQKIGLSVEQLTKLEYAARLSDVSLQGLETAVSRLSRNMSDAAGGTKEATDAFAAVGVAFQNADGTLRDANDVLYDIADRFEGMPDGAAKTAAALDLMGRSGAQMIPLLNGGSASLRALGDEAQRAGLVISTDTAKAAERFNDALTRLKGAAQGLVLKLTAALAPAMANFAEAIVVVVQNLGNLKSIAVEVFDRLKIIVQSWATSMRASAFAVQATFVRAFAAILSAGAATFSALGATEIGGGLGDRATLAGVDADKLNQRAEAAFSNAALLMKDATKPLTSIVGPVNAAGAAVADLGETFEEAAGGGKSGGGGAKGLSDALSELESRAKEIFLSTRTPQEEFATKMAELNFLVDKQAITWDTYGRAVQQAQDELDSFEEKGTSVFDSLGQSFAGLITGMIDGTSSFKDAFAGLLSQFGGNLLSSGFDKVFKSFNLPFFANGTNFAPGGLAVVGERGPELVNLPRGSQVIPNHALGGGNVHVTVGIASDAGLNIMPYVQSISRGEAAAVRRDVPGIVANAQRRAG